MPEGFKKGSGGGLGKILYEIFGRSLRGNREDGEGSNSWVRIGASM